MYFRNYELRNTWFDEFLKNPASEDSSSDNMANGLKHLFNLNDKAFSILFDHSEDS